MCAQAVMTWRVRAVERQLTEPHMNRARVSRIIFHVATSMSRPADIRGVKQLQSTDKFDAIARL
jgi:hypothetical protein